MEAENNNLLVVLYKHYLVMKTFHFQTESSFRHSKVDVYLKNYLANMDKLMEVIQGIHDIVSLSRITIDVNTATDDNIADEISYMLGVLNVQKNRGKIISAIIDQMEADLYQLAYLFSFK